MSIVQEQDRQVVYLLNKRKQLRSHQKIISVLQFANSSCLSDLTIALVWNNF